jgi:hypothetical protein
LLDFFFWSGGVFLGEQVNDLRHRSYAVAKLYDFKTRSGHLDLTFRNLQRWLLTFDFAQATSAREARPLIVSHVQTPAVEVLD